MKFFCWIVLLVMGPMVIHGKTILVQGHRGSRGTHPENTLPSFQEAIDAGADFLELDLLLTKDGHLVIYHDFFLDPELIVHLDGSSIPHPAPLIYSLNLSQVKQLDCGARANPHFPRQLAIPGTQIPTLEELFQMLNSSEQPNAKTVKLNLEIKRDFFHPEYSADPKLVVQTLLSLVKQYGFASRVYYSSFDPISLFHVREQDPDAHIAFLIEDKLDDMITLATLVRAESVSPEHILIDDRIVSLLHQGGFKVILWTVNDPQRWQELIEMGVDGIITDYPRDLLTFLEKRK
jgi:glycerophosphoryl diester phosphodiesterase